MTLKRLINECCICKGHSNKITSLNYIITTRGIEFKPEIIFHLAAQPLIFESYKRPLLTFDVNFRGSLNILEISRKSKFIKSVVIITSDKCYESNNSIIGFKENDILGGYDPYSSSKAAAELAIKSWRSSFFNLEDKNPDTNFFAFSSASIIGPKSSPNIAVYFAKSLTVYFPITLKFVLKAVPIRLVTSIIALL